MGLLRRKRRWPRDGERIRYQQQYVTFDIGRPRERVLDIGSGGHPFPHATVLTDRFIENSTTRHDPLVVLPGKPFLVSDIHDLPFADKSFDFVYCSHALQLTENPLRACQEIMRVGNRGFIETPTFAKDTLFSWARGEQIWHVVAIAQNLCFFEYSDRQLDGIRSPLWRDSIFSKWRDPLQDVFYENQDVFNVLFMWKHEFSVFLFRLDGTVKTLNARVDASDVLQGDAR